MARAGRACWPATRGAELNTSIARGRRTAETLNDLRWKNSEYQVWSSQQDLQLLHRSFSHLRNFYQTLVTIFLISYRLLKLCHTLVKIELHFVQAFSNEKMVYIRIVDIDDMNKLGIQNFSILDNLWFRKLVCRRRNLKITNLNRPNFLKWKVDQNNNCRSFWVQQTWYSKLFNLNSFWVYNTRVKVLFFHLTKFDLVKLAQMRH